MNPNPVTAGEKLKEWLPGAALLWHYERAQFRHDALAALVVALATIPSSMLLDEPVTQTTELSIAGPFAFR